MTNEQDGLPGKIYQHRHAIAISEIDRARIRYRETAHEFYLTEIKYWNDILGVVQRYAPQAAHEDDFENQDKNQGTG